MLPGRKYTPEDFLWIAWSHKWLILIPTVLVAAAAFVYAQALPNLYRSSALVLVIGQQVPKELVRPTVTDTVADRLRVISQQIVTRTKLERIIEEFDLYRAERETGLMEDIVERMRSRDLQINIPTGRRAEDTTSFTVSFTADRPRTAMQVADRIAQLFVQENSATRELQAGSTSQFLQSALEEARRKLQEQDEKIAAFRLRNSGKLPTELASNLQMMTTIQTQLQTNADELMRAHDRIAGLEATAAALTQPVPSAGGRAIAQDAPAAQRLEAAQAALRRLQLRLKDEHPEIRAAKRLIAELEAEAEAEALQAPVSPESAPPAPVRGVNLERLAAIRQQIQEQQTNIELGQQEDERLKKQLASYAARLNSTAGVEAEFSDLMRDYGTLRGNYEGLLKKVTDSELSESLERRQIGEQFRVIESARAPERPISPDRPRLYLMGLMAGLGLGVALAALLEYRDTGFKTDTDVLVSLSLPVLAVIPAMMNSDDKARHRKRTRLGIAAASMASVLLVGAVAAAWKFQIIQDWVR